MKPKIDFWEVIAENFFDQPQALEKLQEISHSYPIHLHCIGNNIGGVDKLNQKYTDQVLKITKAIQPRILSDHLCFQKHNNISHFDLLPFSLNSTSLLRCKKRLTKLQNIYNQEVYIENLSYYIEYKSSHISEADFLNELTSSCNSKILLDLNNIEVNQVNLNHSKKEYLNEIDASLVGEIHLAGTTKNQPVTIDDHASEPSDESIDYLANHPTYNQIPICYERDNNVPDFEKLISYTNLLKQRIMVNHVAKK